MLNLDENEPGSELDLATRQLCPDGACVGVIGDDGCCKICRCQAVGAPSCRAVFPSYNEAAKLETDDSDDFEQRELCPDGNCLGLIGDNRRCNVCGRTA